MSDLSDKAQIFQESNYHYNFDRKIYINRVVKKIFSESYIQDHDINNLKNDINEKNSDWKFYFNHINETIKKELFEELKL